ncbi:MAG: family N-acetyltransferase [Eubacterium sp.]|nr:family N-acetyltransferase [Eubacterium sp.]
MKQNMDIITDVRGFNGFYTNILGLLDKHILDSGYSLTEARVLFEIGKTEHCTANQLASLLEIDRSYLSRIIAKFEKQKLITRHTRNTDSRVSEIRLTEEGEHEFHELNNRSNHQIEQLLSNLKEEEREKVCSAMNIVKKYLTIATTNLTIRPFRE